MKKYFLFLLMFVISGCVAVRFETTPPQEISNQKKNLTKINTIRTGTQLVDVISILGEETPIGYKQEKYPGGAFSPITVKNPYRSEVIKGKTKEYYVAYYFVEIKKSDDLIGDDELLPLVFEEGKLIGKGWDYLFKLKNQINL